MSQEIYISRLFLILLLLFPPMGLAQNYVSVTVLRVSDGDTITVKSAEDTFKIRVAGIDAPESKQLHGKESGNALRSLLKNRSVTASCFKIDKYQRKICRIRTDLEKDVALAMISSGNAWWYKEFAKDQTALEQGLYQAAEKKAQKDRVGLWTADEPVPPWVWRKQQKR